MFGGNLAGLALEEPAPGRADLVQSLAHDDLEKAGVPDSSSNLHDRSYELAYPGNNGASLEEYIYWAKVQREEERQDELRGIGPEGFNIADVFLGLYRKAPWVKRQVPRAETALIESPEPSIDEKGRVAGKPETLTTDLSTPQLEGIHDPKQLEALTTARKMRIAGAVSVFFLITTDILGPSSAPYGMSQNGWAQGNILFFVFGACASSAAVALQWLFLNLDSSRFPLKTYGDIGQRLMGSWMRHLISVLQFLQLIVNCGLLVLSNGQALIQIIDQYVGEYNRNHPGHHRAGLCFAVAIVIFAAIGMVLAQIRSLRGMSTMANLSTVLNWSIVIVSMIVIQVEGFSTDTVAKQLGISDSEVEANPPHMSAWPNLDISDQIQGVNLLVFAYGGAMIFPEILSEMKRPRSFWKGCCMAQLVIYIVYVVYACVVADAAGQYSLSIGYQIMATGNALTYCNVASIITAVVAAAIYGNVGIKVSYINIVEDICRGPSVYSRGGRVVWLVWSCLFWALAFIIGAAIPQINSLSGLISAIAIVNFSYTFPFMFLWNWLVQQDAMKADGEWMPGSGNVRVDRWTQWSRLSRGLFGGGMYTFPKGIRLPAWLVKNFVLLLALGGLTMSGLGLYAAAESIKTAFEGSGAISSSFSCQAPV